MFDFAALLPVPGMTVLAPCDADELCRMLSWTLLQDGPVAIRYGKSGSILSGIHHDKPFQPGRWEVLQSGKDLALLATGSMVRHALNIAGLLKKYHLNAEVVNCSSVKPADEAYLRAHDPGKPFVTLEEHRITGGFGEFITEQCRMLGCRLPDDCIGIPDCFIEHGNHEQLLEDAGISEGQVVARILERLGRETD